ncbi:MAG: MOSC domain-containing protein [Verrucomicrobiales bacterium]|nr:MOSC domain-containing protein [Verrucomicrobiales bacterium]
MELLHLYLSPGHNFVGHHGLPPGTHPMVEVQELDCVAGRGLRGDRYFDHRPDYKGQITFFAFETFDELRRQWGVTDRDPSVFRRNVVVRGGDLNAWISREFEIQGVRFAGVESCKPCYWMDQAFGPGAEAALVGRGGLRARILTDGRLHPGAAAFSLADG